MELPGERVVLRGLDWEELDDNYRHAGIDLFLGRPYTTEASAPTRGARWHATLSTTVATTASRSTPPRTTSERSAAYEKVGFGRVGVMREYWLHPEAVWHDGLLMDLLASELD